LLAACLPDEQHEVGLLLFALAALDRDYSIVLLGSNTPLAELPAVVARAAVQAIVLAGSANTVTITEELQPLCQTIKIPVFIGGQVASRQTDVIHAAGAIPLEEDLGLALRQIDRMLARH
jgi:cobalamin-dependent methionine synthase I